MLVIFIEYFYLELGKEDVAEPNNLEDDEKDDAEADNVEEALDTYDGIDAVIDSFLFNKLSVNIGFCTVFFFSINYQDSSMPRIC